MCTRFNHAQSHVKFVHVIMALLHLYQKKKIDSPKKITFISWVKLFLSSVIVCSMFEFAAWLTLKHACYSILYVLLHKVYICFSQVFPLFFFLFSFFSKCKKDFLCFSKNSIVRFIAFSQLLVHIRDYQTWSFSADQQKCYLCVEKKKYNMLGNWKVYFLE